MDTEIKAFCKEHHIRAFSLFGSQREGTAHAESDVDVLVEFDSGYTPSFFKLAEMQFELEALFQKPVDLRTPQDLSPYFRQSVLNSARRLYEREG
jgi:predicted nucleotidyltransferase